MKTQLAFSASLALAVAVLVAGCAKAPAVTDDQRRMLAFEQRVDAEHDVWLLRWKARTRMLAGLTPAHRELVAQITGRLMTEDAPDVKGAIDRVNKALTPKEKASILAADRWFSQRERAYSGLQRDAMRAAIPFLSLSPKPRKLPVDAGSVLLVAITNGLALHTSLALRGTSESREHQHSIRSGGSR